MSQVWEYFKKDKTKKKTTCSVCNNDFTLSKDGSTSTLRKHLLRAHSIDLDKRMTSNPSSSNTGTVNTLDDYDFSASKYQVVATNLLV